MAQERDPTFQCYLVPPPSPPHDGPLPSSSHFYIKVHAANFLKWQVICGSVIFSVLREFLGIVNGLSFLLNVCSVIDFGYFLREYWLA